MSQQRPDASLHGCYASYAVSLRLVHRPTRSFCEFIGEPQYKIFNGKKVQFLSVRTCPAAAENTEDNLLVKMAFWSFQGTVATFYK